MSPEEHLEQLHEVLGNVALNLDVYAPHADTDEEECWMREMSRVLRRLSSELNGFESARSQIVRGEAKS